jgi:L-cystine uptake protein TcyP (sodium:dicarboxylate symporter family)
MLSANTFVDAYITLVILFGLSSIILLILQLIPKKIMDKVWVKLHLDNDEPYDDIQED